MGCEKNISPDAFLRPYIDQYATLSSNSPKPPENDSRSTA